MGSSIVSVTTFIFHVENLNQYGRVIIVIPLVSLEKNINSLSDYRKNPVNSQWNVQLETSLALI